MDDIERRSLQSTLRQCKRSSTCRPLGVSRADEQAAMQRGFLRWHEWPSGHYEVTDAGREFLSGVEYV